MNLAKYAYALALVSLMIQLIVGGIILFIPERPLGVSADFVSFSFFTTQMLGFLLFDLSGILVGIFFAFGLSKNSYNIRFSAFKFIGVLFLILFGLNILSVSFTFLSVISMLFFNKGMYELLHLLIGAALSAISILFSLLIFSLFAKILHSMDFSGKNNVCISGMLFFGLGAIINSVFLASNLLGFRLISIDLVFIVNVAIGTGGRILWLYFAQAVNHSLGGIFWSLGFDNKYEERSFDI